MIWIEFKISVGTQLEEKKKIFLDLFKKFTSPTFTAYTTGLFEQKLITGNTFSYFLHCETSESTKDISIIINSFPGISCPKPDPKDVKIVSVGHPSQYPEFQ
ncbi:MAG: hypothetical protein HYV29_01725 [Ignavibacteriales bacterium]|nr:hypothetical protein [Ignavibacteriales bacterium]